MGFGSNEKQQRLSFTSQTYEKILFYMEVFEEKKFAAFINRIINNFYPYARSSIEIRLESEKEKIIGILSSNSKDRLVQRLSDDNKSIVISAMLADKKKELCSYRDLLLSRYKTESKKTYLSNDVLDYLTDPTCNEVAHYSRKEYLECLIEEFMGLSLPEMEYYYYIDRIHVINEAINEKYQLKIKTKKGNVRYVKPYKLDSYNGSSNYLIGYCVFDEVNQFKEYEVCYRVSTLTEIKPIRSKSGNITKEKKKALDNRLLKNGAQFFSQGTDQIIVKFHANGFERYLRTSHLRPQYDKNDSKADPDKGIYVFNCTPIQAEFYFTQLGSYVEILEPHYLRDRFSRVFAIGNSIYHK